MEILQLIGLCILVTLSHCETSARPGFVSNICEDKTTKWLYYDYGYLEYDSSLDDTQYDWCSCKLCDTSESKSEMTAEYHAATVLLYKTGQSLEYSYPHGSGWINGSWSNNTEEGTIGASLYTKCTTFTLKLNGAGAQIRLNIDLRVNRSKTSIACQVEGFFTISDSSGQVAPPDEGGFKNVGLAIGLGVGALMIVFSVAGVCVCCKLSNRRASSALTKEELNRNSVVNNSYGDPKPELHRNLDVSAMTINTTTVLDETTSPCEERSPDPGYEAIGTPESENPPGNSGYDNTAFITEDEVPASPLYHTLTDARPQSQLISPENELTVKSANQEDYLKPRSSLVNEEDEDAMSQQAEDNHYEDIGTPRAKEDDTNTASTQQEEGNFDVDSKDKQESADEANVVKNTDDSNDVNEVAEEYSVVNKSRPEEADFEEDRVSSNENIVTEL